MAKCLVVGACKDVLSVEGGVLGRDVGVCVTDVLGRDVGGCVTDVFESDDTLIGITVVCISEVFPVGRDVDVVMFHKFQVKFSESVGHSVNRERQTTMLL